MHIIQRTLPQTLPELTVSHPVLQRIYAARGIADSAELDTSLSSLEPFTSLLDIDKAVMRLRQALDKQQRILIVGDFDADGATSSALAVSALRTFGVNQVEFLVPNRFEYGYGLTPGIITLAQKWQPDLIITVDNGIASLEGVRAANEAGIDVLITDHHLPGDELPDACAIVNPNRADDSFPSKSIAGVGVIFYVMLALRRHLVNEGWFESKGLSAPNMAQFLDLVALGTVADVVALDKNNRILVSQGLRRIKKGLCRPGIRALIEVSGRKQAKLRESDLGFAIAPRLNAAGRLDDMSLGIDCLLCNDHEKAHTLAMHLDELNVERRKIESEMKEQALQALNHLTEKVATNAKDLPSALCLIDESWHQGVIGILAGRLKDKFHRPVIAFAVINEGELKASARSIQGLNIRDILAAIDKDKPGLISKFGGHAMAAGLTLHPDNFNEFKTRFIDEVDKYSDPSMHTGDILTDGALVPDDLNLKLAGLLNDAGPWGQHFPEPVFDNRFEILDQRLVGERHLKLTLAHERGGEPLDAIAFNVDLKAWPNHRATIVHAAYKLDINEYAGRTRLQLIIIDMKAQG